MEHVPTCADSLVGVIRIDALAFSLAVLFYALFVLFALLILAVHGTAMLFKQTRLGASSYQGLYSNLQKSNNASNNNHTFMVLFTGAISHVPGIGQPQLSVWFKHVSLSLS
jgi:hypothetical protein